MIAVIFEVFPTKKGKEEYLAIAADLRERLDEMPGFISIERFQSLSDPDKLLSLSFWTDEESVAQWRNLEEHRLAQSVGRERLFQDYRIRVGGIIRDYSMQQREQAPDDSKGGHA
jgi:heme-degrading monooxygenase HmoA